MHELSHAYWGAFAVTGHPELSWGNAKGSFSAGERYHQDVLRFMQQPPDHYELLRARLPKDSLDALFHSVEADLVSTVGGDLNLIPPILRKYWDQFLQPGPFHSWYGAMIWYQSLPNEDRALAERYTGFQHIDLRQYKSLKPASPSQLTSQFKEILRYEERQQLWDFADQFDLLLVATEQEENFHFWRGYLRGMLDHHKQHPEYIPSLDLPRADEIAEALNFLTELQATKPEQKPELVIQEFDRQPFLLHFLPALDNRTLLQMFTSGAELPKGATIKGTAGFVELLKDITPHVDKILEVGRHDPGRGATELKRFLVEVDFGERVKLDIFFEVLQHSDEKTARNVVAALDNATLRHLFKLTQQGYLPARMRGLLEPPRLLQMLDITPEAPEEKLSEGIEDMMKHPAGNFLIDEPFVDAMYQVLVTRVDSNPEEALSVVNSSPFPMERFILNYPAMAAQMLTSDLDVTVTMIKASDPLHFPPARFIYRLIYADPHLAALVVERLDEGLSVEALAHFAYDADRLAAAPSLPISLERNGLFLSQLLADKGKEWLQERIDKAVRQYVTLMEEGEISMDFLEAYKRTLDGSVATLGDERERIELEKILGSITFETS